MGLYAKNGLYNGYDKKNKEREVLDYYATPTEEVENILETLNINLNDLVILEPCAGGGHMAKGIENYCKNNNYIPKVIIKTDIMDRGCEGCLCGPEYDFFSDDYPCDKADIIIMNPPYSCIEGFMIRALEIAPIVIMLGRTQTLEGKDRYANVFKENPPTEIYQYVDRINCWKNGEKPKTSSAQAYAWYVWNRNLQYKGATWLKWIRRK